MRIIILLIFLTNAFIKISCADVNTNATYIFLKKLEIEDLIKRKSSMNPQEQAAQNYTIAEKLKSIGHFKGAIKYFIKAYSQENDNSLKNQSKIELDLLLNEIQILAHKFFSEKSFNHAKKFYKLLLMQDFNDDIKRDAMIHLEKLKNFSSPKLFRPIKETEDSEDEEMEELDLHSHTFERSSLTPSSLIPDKAITPLSFINRPAYRYSPSSPSNLVKKTYQERVTTRTIPSEVLPVSCNLGLKKSNSEPNNLAKQTSEIPNQLVDLLDPSSIKYIQTPQSETQVMENRQLSKTLEIENARAQKNGSCCTIQ